MKIEVLNKSVKADCLIMPVWEDKKLDAFERSVDRHFNGLVSDLKTQKDVEGKPMQSAILYTQDKQLPRVYVIGLGNYKKLTIRTYKHIIGSAIRSCQEKKWQDISIILSSELLKKFNPTFVASNTIISAKTASYSFDNHKEEKQRVKPINTLSLIGDFDARLKKIIQCGVQEGNEIAEAINFTRELGNTVPSVMTPTFLAKKAEKLSKEYKNVTTKILSKNEIKKLGMGCLLGVAQGSIEEPKFIIVEYSGATKSQKPTVLIGKGITFDSGGLSIKPANYLCDMKFDMLGAATVLGCIKAAAGLDIKKNIVGLIPSCENMPSGNAYRPDDILINMEGISVLVDNTDAEGRLILSDALSYAKKYKPYEVIDFATLTGACMVALGNERSGLFSPDEKIIKKLEKSSETVGEQLWRLPLGEEYSESIKSEVADVVNTGVVGGKPGYGGASTAAAFLQFFTLNKDSEPAYPWAHIDLSCSYYGGKGKPYIRSGANGFGVETMVEYLRN